MFLRRLIILCCMIGTVLPTATLARPADATGSTCGPTCCCPPDDCPCAHPAPKSPETPLPAAVPSIGDSSRLLHCLPLTHVRIGLMTTGFDRVLAVRHAVPAQDSSCSRLCRWTT